MAFTVRRFLSVILVVLCWNFTSGRSFSSEYKDDWNLFVFTQWWPETQCYYYQPSYYDGVGVSNSRMNKSCVPPGIFKWTIHGLWPTLGVEHKPTYCNNSWPFDISVIEDLIPELELQWPSFEPHKEENGFWKHEWEKHGTCSTSLPYLNSEYKYFAVTLFLNIKCDIYSVLSRKGIVPSDRQTYQVKDVEQALFDSYGTRSTVYCITPKYSEQMLSYVELCLNKSLGLIDCDNTTSHCDYDKPILYPPIVRQSGPMWNRS